MTFAIHRRCAGAARLFRGLLLTFVLSAASFCQAAHAQQATAHDYEGTYGGQYKASQGITRMVLVLEALSDTEVGARYVFYPDNSNPGVPTGEFLLAGTIDAKTGKLLLVGKQWIEHPKNYLMVDVTCLLDADRKTLTGLIYLPQDKTAKFEFKTTRWSRMPQ